MSDGCKIKKNGDIYSVGYNTAEDIAKIYCETAASATVANPPLDLVAVPGNGQISLSWTAPTDGGSAITDYKIEYSINGNFWTTFADGISNNTSTIVTGLTNGTLYVFRVSAINAIGTSNPSGFSNPVRPYTTPSAPSITSLVRLTGSGVAIVVTWSAPTSDGGSPIQAYRIEYNDGSSWFSKTVSGDILTTVVDSLTNGQSYIFRIVAINAAGDGTFSNNSAPIIPATIPQTPTAQLTTIGDSQLAITWVAPPSDGGLDITDYLIQFSTDFSNWQLFNDGTSVNNTTTITGLENGQTYFWRVAAVNGIGAGSYSSLSFLAYGVPGRIPDAPTNPVATPSVNSASFEWTTPAEDGGYDIIEYRIQYSIDSGPWIFLQDIASSSTSITVDNLENNKSYAFRVSAKNNIGYSSYSVSSNAVTPSTTIGNITDDHCLVFIDEAHPLYVKGSGSVGALWGPDISYYRSVSSSHPDYATILFDVDTPFVARGSYKGQQISSDPFYIYPTGVNGSDLVSCYLPVPKDNITGIARPSGGMEYNGSSNAIGSISADAFASGIVNTINTVWGTNFWNRMKDSYNPIYNRPCKLWLARGNTISLGSGILSSGIEIFTNYTVSSKNWTVDQTPIYINRCGERYLGWITDCVVYQGDSISCNNMVSLADVTIDNECGTNFGDRLTTFYIDPADYPQYPEYARCSGTIDDQFDGNLFYAGFSLKLHPLFSCTGVYAPSMAEAFIKNDNRLLAQWRFDSFPFIPEQNPAQRENSSEVYAGKAYLTYENQAPYITVGVSVWDDRFVEPTNSVPGIYYIWKTAVPVDIYGVPSGIIEEPFPITSGRMRNDVWIAESYEQHLLTDSLGFPTLFDGPAIEPGTGIPVFPDISFESSPACLFTELPNSICISADTATNTKYILKGYPYDRNI